jgi:hypothetical protein
MAIISPGFENIDNLIVKPTEGEYTLLRFLFDNLDDTYEIYFQPWLNGDNPDIVLLKKNCGVIIIEVKDWLLNNFTIDDKKRWRVKKNNAYIISPLEQVFRYKQNIYNLHINKLLELKIKNPKIFSFVICAVYFHKETKADLFKFSVKPFNDDKAYKNYLRYFELLGKDSRSQENLKKIIKRRKLDEPNPLFTDELYDSFKRYLQPTWHQIENGIEINYSTKQKELIISQDKQQKIRGVAGSGKSMLLAKRAVNANKRINSKILILTFNISLRNYLHDKLNEIRDNFYWGNFEILHYHEFIRTKANKHNLPPLSISDYSNTNLFEKVKNRIQGYGSIFIDEVQDYEEEWLEIIKKYFLKDRSKSEYVVFADEKQNIYDRKLDTDKKPYTGVPGKNWNELKESFRLSNAITELANSFQKHFFKEKYEIEDIQSVQLGFQFDIDKQIIKYIYKEASVKVTDYYDDIFKIILLNNIHPNNICILSPNVSELRKLDYLVRNRSNEKTMIMFETLEIYFHQLLDFLSKNKTTSYLQKEFINYFNGSLHDAIIYLCIREIQEYSSESFKYIKTKYELDDIKLEKICLQIDGVRQSNESNYFNDKIKEIRRNKKFNFWMNPGTMKISTIHSFKGWEIHTLILIIANTEKNNILEEDTKEFISDELIYTALTRCRYNLIVLNLGIKKYDAYFKRNLNIVS